MADPICPGCHHRMNGVGGMCHVESCRCVCTDEVEIAETIKESADHSPRGDDPIALARRVVDLLGRCQVYGPADALRDAAARLLTRLVDEGAPR